MASLAESRESAREALEEEAVRSGEPDEGAESCPVSCIAEEEGAEAPSEAPSPATGGEDGEEDESDDEEDEEEEDPWEALEAR